MEIGPVKFFDTREGKLFGFLVDGRGIDLFFHYSGGCKVTLDKNRDIALEQAPPRYPKKGDYLMFERGQNAKGAKATLWCFEDDYQEMSEKRRRDLTIDEAKQHLAGKLCNILTHTYSTSQYGTVTTMVTTTVAWLTSDGHQVA